MLSCVYMHLTSVDFLACDARQIVKLRRLKKLQMSFNNLRSLPSGMGGMRNLELCRYSPFPTAAFRVLLVLLDSHGDVL